MKQHKYSYETRLAAAKAVVDDKKDVVSVMRAYSIFSPLLCTNGVLFTVKAGPRL